MKTRLRQRLAFLLVVACSAGVEASSAGTHFDRTSDAPAPDPAARAHECPNGLTGAWHSVLPAALLFDVELTVVERHGNGMVAIIRTQAGVEEVRAWTGGERIRFQSTDLPLSFAGAIASDGSSLDGFIQQSSSIVRVSLQYEGVDGERSWTTGWTPLTTPDREVAFDLYVEEDDEGGIGGYFFFRDQRLPGLWGYGLR